MSTRDLHRVLSSLLNTAHVAVAAHTTDARGELRILRQDRVHSLLARLPVDLRRKAPLQRRRHEHSSRGVGVGSFYSHPLRLAFDMGTGEAVGCLWRCRASAGMQGRSGMTMTSASACKGGRGAVGALHGRVMRAW